MYTGYQCLALFKAKKEEEFIRKRAWVCHLLDLKYSANEKNGAIDKELAELMPKSNYKLKKML